MQHPLPTSRKQFNDKAALSAPIAPSSYANFHQSSPRLLICLCRLHGFVAVEEKRGRSIDFEVVYPFRLAAIIQHSDLHDPGRS